MKFLIVALAFASLTVHADSSDVFSFGRGNVMSGGISNSVDMSLKKHGESENDRYYDFKCTKSGILKKNKLVFKVVEKSTKSVIVEASSKVDDCPQLLRDIYHVAFDRKAAAVVVLKDADDKGMRKLSVSFSKSVEVVE